MKIDVYLGTPLCALFSFLKKAFLFLGIKKRGRLEDVRRILAIKLVAIGDLVLLLPSLKALRERFPDGYIALLTNPRVKEVVEGLPFVDEIIYYDVFNAHRGLKGFFYIQTLLKEKGFDLVVEFDQRYRMTSLLAFLSGALLHAGFSVPWQGRRGLMDIRVSYDEEKHEMESFLDIVKALGAEVRKPELVSIPHSMEDEKRVERFISSHGLSGKNIVILHTVTSPLATERRWEKKKFARLADYLLERGVEVVFTGSPADLSYIEEIMTLMKGKPVVAAGELSLKEFSVLAARSSLVVSVDTGALHIAAASGSPVIGLYGPSDPRKWSPYGKKHTFIYKNFPCSPCNIPLYGKTPDCEDPRCMKEIEVEEVIKVIEEKYSSVFKTED
jgi:lipopolysaccharide heptosyltransferase II